VAGRPGRSGRGVLIAAARRTVATDAGAVSGAAAGGEPWKFYDLGHGYCTYDVFDQCSYRMACAKCAFYRPRDSTQAQMLEAKANLLRRSQDVPLTDDERAAVDDGLAALEKLCAGLADVPAPAGPTPRQLASATLPPPGLRPRPPEPRV
jgi:hypothetical protein